MPMLVFNDGSDPVLVHDFDDGKGLVPAHRHTNGGGWVANTAKVAKTAYVGPNAKVYGRACVTGLTQIYHFAQVYGNACVTNNTKVCDDAHVFGSAAVADTAFVYGRAKVYGSARVFGNAHISSSASICGFAEIGGNTWISGDLHIYDDVEITDDIKITNETEYLAYRNKKFLTSSKTSPNPSPAKSEYEEADTDKNIKKLPALNKPKPIVTTSYNKAIYKPFVKELGFPENKSLRVVNKHIKLLGIESIVYPTAWLVAFTLWFGSISLALELIGPSVVLNFITILTLVGATAIPLPIVFFLTVIGMTLAIDSLQ